MILVDPTGLLVEVICEPVQQYRIGFAIGARHCRLRVSCGATIPDKTYELNGRSAAQPFTFSNFDPSRPGYRVKLKRPGSDSCCNFEQCLIKQAQMYWDHPSIWGQYDPVNHNSNAWIYMVVESCGGEVKFKTFQFLSPLGWYHFYGQMPSK